MVYKWSAKAAKWEKHKEVVDEESAAEPEAIEAALATAGPELVTQVRCPTCSPCLPPLLLFAPLLHASLLHSCPLPSHFCLPWRLQRPAVCR